MQALAELDRPHLAMDEPRFGEDPWPHFVAARASHPWLASCKFGTVVSEYGAMKDLLWMDDSMHAAITDIVDIMDARDTPWGKFQVDQIIAYNRPEHRRLREILASAFTPRQAQRHRPVMREQIGKLLEEWAPKGAFDFEEFASYFPISVMCRLIGAPPAIIPGLKSSMEALGLRMAMDASKIHGAPARAAGARSLAPGECVACRSNSILPEEGGQKLNRRIHANFTRFLVNRLRYEADVAKHPEILDEDVSDPIVVLGWARSGTTKLQRFLSADPRFRPTPAWAMFNPAPFPGEKRGDPTPRREWANAMMNAVTNCNDSYQVMHEFEADEADETSFIPLASFDSPSLCVTAPEPVYAAWSRARSRIPAIEYCKKMLQYLQWQGGGRRGPWLIKNPLNTREMAEMAEVFPNATFVTSKRDLVTTMGSCMRMISEILTNTFDPLDMKLVGTVTVEQAVHELNRFVRQRDALKGKVRLLEISYGRCVKDAMNVARELYALAGLPWTAEGEAAMAGWEERNPRHKLGSYGYSLEDYGWSKAMVKAAFGPIEEEWREN